MSDKEKQTASGSFDESGLTDPLAAKLENLMDHVSSIDVAEMMNDINELISTEEKDR